MKQGVVLLLLLLTSLMNRSFAMNLSIESPAFSANTLIPSLYTCTGSDLSPPLIWQDDSPATQSYALIVDDPDAPGGTWDHWILFNIPSSIKYLEEGTEVPSGAISGRNSWGQTGYRGPCPPRGTHRYRFKLYVLDTQLNLTDLATKKEVMQAMSGHIVASSELIGLYRK